MRTKILWITPYPNKNINELMFNYLGKYNKNLNLVMMVPDAVRGREVNNKNFEIKYMKYKSYGDFLFIPLKIANWIKGKSNLDTIFSIGFDNFNKKTKDEKPNIIIANTIYNVFTIQAARYCKKNKVPFILQIEMQRFNSKTQKILLKIFFKLFKKALFDNAKLILCWTDDGIEFAKNNFGKKNRKKIMLLPAPINTKIFYPTKKKESKKLRILNIARMTPYKRHIDLLKACLVLKKRNINFELNLYGEGPIKQEIRDKIKKMGLEKEVNFPEKTTYEKLKEVYSNNDIFILPSYNEAIGMVVPEAMACGTPAIVSDTCGAKVYVKDRENGLIFETYNYKELAEKIIEISVKNKIKTMGQNALKTIKKQFSVEIINKKFEEIIEDKK